SGDLLNHDRHCHLGQVFGLDTAEPACKVSVQLLGQHRREPLPGVRLLVSNGTKQVFEVHWCSVTHDAPRFAWPKDQLSPANSAPTTNLACSCRLCAAARHPWPTTTSTTTTSTTTTTTSSLAARLTSSPTVGPARR